MPPMEWNITERVINPYFNPLIVHKWRFFLEYQKHYKMDLYPIFTPNKVDYFLLKVFIQWFNVVQLQNNCPWFHNCFGHKTLQIIKGIAQLCLTA